jgi:hypothetical protein
MKTIQVIKGGDPILHKETMISAGQEVPAYIVYDHVEYGTMRCNGRHYTPTEVEYSVDMRKRVLGDLIKVYGWNQDKLIKKLEEFDLLKD